MSQGHVGPGGSPRQASGQACKRNMHGASVCAAANLLSIKVRWHSGQAKLSYAERLERGPLFLVVAGQLYGDHCLGPRHYPGKITESQLLSCGIPELGSFCRCDPCRYKPAKRTQLFSKCGTLVCIETFCSAPALTAGDAFVALERQ
jgi:hypothetical protein